MLTHLTPCEKCQLCFDLQHSLVSLTDLWVLMSWVAGVSSRHARSGRRWCLVSSCRGCWLVARLWRLRGWLVLWLGCFRGCWLVLRLGCLRGWLVLRLGRLRGRWLVLWLRRLILGSSSWRRWLLIVSIYTYLASGTEMASYWRGWRSTSSVSLSSPKMIRENIRRWGRLISWWPG